MLACGAIDLRRRVGPTAIGSAIGGSLIGNNEPARDAFRRSEIEQGNAQARDAIVGPGLLYGPSGVRLGNGGSSVQLGTGDAGGSLVDDGYFPSRSVQMGQTYSDAYGPVNSFEPTAQSLQLSRGAQTGADSPVMDTREEALRRNINDLRALGQQATTERALRNMGDLADAYRASGMTVATGDDDQDSAVQRVVITGSRMTDEQKAQYDIAQLAAVGQYSGYGSIRAIGPVEGFFTFNPAGRFLSRYGQSAANIVSSLYTVPKELVLTAGDAVGNATYGALNRVFGGSQVYENDGALFRSIDNNGVLGTIGLATTGTVRSLPGISQIDALYRRDLDALADSLPTTLLAGSGLVLGRGSGPLFSVDRSMFAADEAAGVRFGGSYIKNPTAQSLSDLVTESGRIGGKQMNGQYMYVIDSSGDITIGTRGGQRMPHPTLIGGEDPLVLGAGIVDIRAGRIYSIDNASGHFKPGAGSLDAARDAFGRLPAKVFRPDFQGYLPYKP
jgi:hypothetical protein